MIERPLILEWVRRLRSGDYAQGTEGALCRFPLTVDGETESQFCCLGVLGEILVQVGVLDAWDSENVRHYGASGDDDHDTAAYLPSEFLPQGIQGRLAELNDHGAPFAEIADVIERDVLPKSYPKPRETASE